jgi:glyoxylase-like metal-dependent hydrolase (beta-lactamase superfamily II)
MSRRTAPSMSRRTFLQDATASAACASSVLASKLSAQQIISAQPINDAAAMRAAGASAKISVERLRGNINVLIGSGGNMAVLPGREGKVLVDAGFATSQRQISKALDHISNDPIQHLIDTHWHFDHTDGNEWIHNAGATIIGHENTRNRLGARQEIPEFRGIFPPSAAGALPAIVFSNEKTIHANGEELLLEHYAPAHSDSDISVRFLQADVLHTGDTSFNGVYPFIDYHNGGSLDGMIAASARNLRMADDKTIVVPGHGPIGGKAQLAEYDVMLNEVRQRVTTLKHQGRSAQEAIAAGPSSRFDGTWGGGLVPSKAFVELVYVGIG